MATITLKYDGRNSFAQKTIDYILSLNLFKVVDSQHKYNKEFVDKIKRSEDDFANGRYKVIKTEDLWK